MKHLLHDFRYKYTMNGEKKAFFIRYCNARRILGVMALAWGLFGTVPTQAQATLTATTPARNAVNAPRNSDIQLTFSEAMNAATAGKTAIVVHGDLSGMLGGKVGSSFTGGGTPTISFKRGTAWKPGEKISVIVTKQAQNMGGTAAKPTVFDFTVAAGSGPAEFKLFKNIETGTSPRSLCTADFNGDGITDFACANSGSSNVTIILLGAGKGNMLGGNTTTTGLEPYCIKAADFDNDGDMDVVTANYSSNNVSVRLNDGQGNFSGTNHINVGEKPIALAVADIDADGDLDVLVANSVANSVSVLRNGGLADFTKTEDIAVDGRPYGITTADFDKDGAMDFATANQNTNNVSVKMNDGTGKFMSGTTVAVGSQPYAVCAADFNGDGNEDLATANYGSNDMSIRLNNGSGSFNGTNTTPIEAQPRDVQAGDLDGDGDMDVVTGNYGQNNVTAFINNGQGIFSLIADIKVASNPGSVGIADLDGDLDMDIISANLFTNNVSMILNDVNTNIAHKQDANHMAVYPNPGTGLFTVVLPTDKQQTIKISNVWGNLVWQTLSKPEEGRTLLDLRTLPKGIYWLQANKWVQKIVVQ